MIFKHWRNLSENQKNALLKKLGIAGAVIFIFCLVLLLMKCQSCGSGSSKKRNFNDSEGHSYGEEISGSDIFDEKFENATEDFTISNNADNQLNKVEENENQLKNQNADAAAKAAEKERRRSRR